MANGFVPSFGLSPISETEFIQQSDQFSNPLVPASAPAGPTGLQRFGQGLSRFAAGFSDPAGFHQGQQNQQLKRQAARESAMLMVLERLAPGDPRRSPIEQELDQSGFGDVARALGPAAPQSKFQTVGANQSLVEITPGGQAIERFAAPQRVTDSERLRNRVIQLKKRGDNLTPDEETELSVLDPGKSEVERLIKREVALSQKSKRTAKENAELGRVSELLDNRIDFMNAIMGRFGAGGISLPGQPRTPPLNERQQKAMAGAQRRIQEVPRARSAVIQRLKDNFGFTDIQIEASGL